MFPIQVEILPGIPRNINDQVLECLQIANTGEIIIKKMLSSSLALYWQKNTSKIWQTKNNLFWPR